MGKGATIVINTVCTNYSYFFKCPVAPTDRVLRRTSGCFPVIKEGFMRTRDRRTSVGVICNTSKAKREMVATSSKPNIDLVRRKFACLTNTRLPTIVISVVETKPKLKGVKPRRKSCGRVIGNKKRKGCGGVMLTPGDIRRVYSLAVGTFRLTSG